MQQTTKETTPVFTKEMKKTHTILIPEMIPIHFELIRSILEGHGYKAKMLRNNGPQVAQVGLKYVHNDMCYPALLVIGQMIDALQSGEYDLEHTAVIITQTGGGCRASNYLHLLRKALMKADLGHIPVISLNIAGMEANPGFRITLPMLYNMMVALLYGDELMLLANQARPYEVQAGETDEVLSKWLHTLSLYFHKKKGLSIGKLRRTMGAIAKDFDAIQLYHKKKIKVGIVGEIYMKYASLGNNHLEAFLQEQDCEARIPGVLGFILYCIGNSLEDYKLYGGNPFFHFIAKIAMKYLCSLEKILLKSISKTKYLAPSSFSHLRSLVTGVVGLGSKMGEGWLLTAEMLELVEQGYPNIVCAQPFGCLPNHINGRGMMNRIKEIAPNANIVAIDYDPGAARVNQENRIKLMLASASAPEHKPKDNEKGNTLSDARDEAGVLAI